MFRAAPIHRERDREVDARDAHHGRDADLNNEVMYMCLARVNPVTLAVGNTVKRVVIIAAAMVVLGEAMEPVAMVGTTVAIAGVLLYSILKQRLA